MPKIPLRCERCNKPTTRNEELLVGPHIVCYRCFAYVVSRSPDGLYRSED
jgi:formylmethanofuran dehydrogenase subunit E